MRALSFAFSVIAFVTAIFTQSVYAKLDYQAVHSITGGYGYAREWRHSMDYAAASQSEDCQRFLNDTRELRRELANKRFEYDETVRNPQASRETKSQIEDQIMDLQEKIQSKNTKRCYW